MPPKSDRNLVNRDWMGLPLEYLEKMNITLSSSNCCSNSLSFFCSSSLSLCIASTAASLSSLSFSSASSLFFLSSSILFSSVYDAKLLPNSLLNLFEDEISTASVSAKGAHCFPKLSIPAIAMYIHKPSCRFLA